MKVRILSIIATAAMLMFCGCATEHYVTDAKHPEIEIKDDGGVTYRGRYVDVEDLPSLLRKNGFEKTDTINIRCSENMKDWRLQRKVMSVLARNGFTRPMLVSERKAYSETTKKKK